MIRKVNKMKGNQTNEMHFEAKLCDSFFEEKKKKKGKEIQKMMVPHLFNLV